MDGGLRRIFQDALPAFHWQSVETGMTGRGVPDTNYCFDGVEGWVEYKLTSGHAINLRPEQVGWLLRRARVGGRCWVAVRRRCLNGPRRDAADELWLCRGEYAPALRQGGLRGALAQGGVVGSWPGGPRRWDWEAIAAWLVACEASPADPKPKKSRSYAL